MKKIFLILLVLSGGLTAAGQFEKIIQPSDLKQQTIITEPVTLRKGFFRTGIGLSYTVKDKYFNAEGSKEYRPTSLWGSYYCYNFSLQYGVSDRFEIDIDVPLVNNRERGVTEKVRPALNSDVSSPTNLKSSGLSDCILGMYYQLIPDKGKKFSLMLSGDFSIPTGSKDISGIKDLTNYNLPTGEGIFKVSAGLFARKIVYPYSFSSGLTYYYNFEGTRLIKPDDISKTKFKTGNVIIINGSFNLHLNEWIALANEFQYFYQGKSKEEYMVVRTTDPRWDIDYIPKLVFQVRRFRISEFVMIPLYGKNIDADPKYAMAVQYTF
jgi:hypothetical protein